MGLQEGDSPTPWSSTPHPWGQRCHSLGEGTEEAHSPWCAWQHLSDPAEVALTCSWGQGCLWKTARKGNCKGPEWETPKTSDGFLRDELRSCCSLTELFVSSAGHSQAPGDQCWGFGVWEQAARSPASTQPCCRRLGLCRMDFPAPRPRGSRSQPGVSPAPGAGCRARTLQDLAKPLGPGAPGRCGSGGDAR